MLYKLVLTFDSVDEILNCEYISKYYFECKTGPTAKGQTSLLQGQFTKLNNKMCQFFPFFAGLSGVNGR